MDKRQKIKKIGILTGLLLFLIFSTCWAGESVSFSVSCTIPSIPGVNAPARIPEISMRDYQRQDVANKNSTITLTEEVIEKEERKETLLAQGEKVTTEVRTIYAR